MNYAIYPPEELIENGVVSMPLSKSIANRALILAAMTRGDVPEPQSPDCEDTLVLKAALAQLRKGENPTVDIANCGTAMRFLTAYIAASDGLEATLTGSPRMLQRPIGQLVDALRKCGAEIEYLGEEGYPPLHIKGRTLDGGTVTVDATVSSQFVSALLMAAPLMRNGLTLNLDGEPVSAPYIAMTLNMMDNRGIASERSPLSVTVGHGEYSAPERDDAEGDWSAAAFFYEITAVSAGWLTLRNLSKESLQGDSRAMDWFGELGVVTELSEEVENAIDLQPSPEVYGRLDIDLSDTPDMAPALVVSCCLLGVPFRFVGLQGLAIKETDRLQALVEEMAKIGCNVEKIRDFGLEWDARRRPISVMPVFDPRGDHRLAMAVAPVSVFVPGIVVCDAECVAKSFPGYWDALKSLGFTLKEAVLLSPEEAAARDDSFENSDNSGLSSDNS